MKEKAQKLEGMLLGHVMAFSDGGEGDCYEDELAIIEVTDIGDGFTEIAFDHDDRRIYIRFRDVSLGHARNDKV